MECGRNRREVRLYNISSSFFTMDKDISSCPDRQNMKISEYEVQI